MMEFLITGTEYLAGTAPANRLEKTQLIFPRPPKMFRRQFRPSFGDPRLFARELK